MRRIKNVLGIMNGTSLDGADFVLVQIHANSKLKNPAKSKDTTLRSSAGPARAQPKATPLNIRFVEMQSFRFTTELKKRLSLAAQHLLKTNELALLHHDLGRFYARCFSKLSKTMRDIDLIGLHGQTVFHQAPRATLQIGEASYLASLAKVPVVADFRVADMALSGQGAPIATLFHDKVFASHSKTVAIHNLGGISNLTLMSRGRVLQSFDTGPANMLLDICVKKHTRGKKQFDRNGQLARLGLVDYSTLQKMLLHPYFRKKAPKSCGREEFGESFFAKHFRQIKKSNLKNDLATLAEFTALSIVNSYKKLAIAMPEEIVFCGGGALNTFVIERIQFHLPKIKITTCEDHGWPVSSIEGGAFALLAYFKMMNWVSNYPHTTGAKRGASLGKIVSV